MTQDESRTGVRHDPPAHPTPVALVTGGAIRVGRAITLALAEAGYDVVIHYRASEAPAEELAERIRGLGRDARTVAADLSDADAVPAVVAGAERGFGRLDLLVNNAAGFDRRALLDADPDAWDAVMDLNLRAPHLLVRAAAPMLGRTRGSVVNIVDLSAFQPWTDYPIHSVAKAALAHLTRVQARALAPDIRVNAIAPGAVLPPDDYDPGQVEALRRRAPLQRLGTPDDVARTVLFLARSDFITGQVLAVDGGRLLGVAGG